MSISRTFAIIAWEWEEHRMVQYILVRFLISLIHNQALGKLSLSSLYKSSKIFQNKSFVASLLNKKISLSYISVPSFLPAS